MSSWRDPAALRLQAARVIAWTLLLAGWVGLTSMAMQFASGPFAALGLIALWLLALGALSVAVARWRLSVWAVRGCLIAGGAVAAQGLVLTLQGGGLATLVPSLLGWAWVVALASSTVRARRVLLSTRPAAPLGAAATGAFVAWFALGDPGDLPALAWRLGLLIGASVLALAWLQPSGHVAAARPGCRAGLFDCSLPAWPAGAWQSPRHWPIWLSLVVMLPMMCSLPWMIALCRSESVPARAVVGLHFAAMLLPGLWLGRRAGAAAACGPLLVLGAFAAAGAAWSPGGSPMWLWLLVAAHGSAWSLAWATQLGTTGWRPAANASPLRSALLHAGLALVLGGLLAWVGPNGFVLWHLAIGALAVVAMAASVARRPAGAAG